eukprot:jgi/Hompol1/6208/HPOL_004885-RA
MTSLAIPGTSLVHITISFIFQSLPLAFAFTFASTCIGAVLAIQLFGRCFQHYFQSRIDGDQLLKRTQTAIEALVSESDGSAMTLLFRCAVPFAIGSHLFASIEMDPGAYFAGTIISALLHVAPYTFVGAMFMDILVSTSTLTLTPTKTTQSKQQVHQDKRGIYTLLVILMTAEAVIVIILSIMLRKALRKIDLWQRQQLNYAKADKHISVTLRESTLISLVPNARLKRSEIHLIVGSIVVGGFVMAAGILSVWLVFPRFFKD